MTLVNDRHPSDRPAILVTGGTGYIGSHTCVVLAEAGYHPVIIDNLSNSSPSVLGRLAEISGQEAEFIEGDIRDSECLERLFSEHDIKAVLHFAGLKAVGESVEQPERYQDNNVGGTRTLLAAMDKASVHTLVFSSSATVYGDPETCPINEDAPRSAANPYGQTKLDIEHILELSLIHI